MLTALGNPVVPDEKLRKPQTSKFVLPLGMLKTGACSFSCFPISTSSLIVLYPSKFPSSKKSLSFEIPTFFAAAVATSILFGCVMRNFASAVLSA